MYMYVSVRVLAGQRRESIEPLKDGRLKISVKEPAERGLANARVRALVARHCKVPVARVRLISGAHQPAKLFSVTKQNEPLVG